MKRFLWIALHLVSTTIFAQARFELQQFSGVVKGIEPGFRFALERLCLDVDGKRECFVFYPDYGQLLFEKIKIGDRVELKVNVNLKVRDLKKDLSEANRTLSWFLFRDQIEEIKIGEEWVPLPKPKEKSEPNVSKVFLEQKIIEEYWQGDIKHGLLFDGGRVAFNQAANKYLDPFKDAKKGDKVSYYGYRLPMKPGYRYPVEGVKEVHHFLPLTGVNGQLRSYLFKQNHVCIGAKFETESGKEITVSFPSYRAVEIKEFINPKEDLKVYFGSDYGVGKFSLPELHAIIQGIDTLRIEEFGFYGGADGKHNHKDIGIVGKITSLERTPKGNVASIIVDSEYYVEIDAMMAQQIGYVFRKGLLISIIGKERIKDPGEIYKKNYKIVVPEKVVVDGKTFSLFQP